MVFIEQPIKLDLLKFMLYSIQGKSFHKVMNWEPETDTVFHVVDRRTGEVGGASWPINYTHTHTPLSYIHVCCTEFFFETFMFPQDQVQG